GACQGPARVARVMSLPAKQHGIVETAFFRQGPHVRWHLGAMALQVTLVRANRMLPRLFGAVGISFVGCVVLQVQLRREKLHGALTSLFDCSCVTFSSEPERQAEVFARPSLGARARK